MIKHIRRHFRPRLHPLALAAALVTLAPLSGTAAPMTIAIVGDSIGEGVQAADAAWQTQIYAYGAWIARQLGAELVIPYIQTSPFGVVGETSTRQRLFPDDEGNNVSVSGANLADALYERADADTPESISSETDLVMFPRTISQIEYVTEAAPDLVLCWIGANDALAAVTAFDALDASQLTPLEDFKADYAELTSGLGDLIRDNGTKVVFANVPDVTAIGYLVDDATAEEFLHFPVGLDEGEYTTIVALLLMSLAGNDALLDDDGFVLSAEEVDTIRRRIADFNAEIQARADEIGMPVVDINGWFAGLITDSPTFFGIPLETRLLGGIFSLDQVHPSNISHALIANEFIETINHAFQMNVPLVSRRVLALVFLTDPSIDKDGDGSARGRPGVGLLESLALIVGLTGDLNDLRPD